MAIIEKRAKEKLQCGDLVILLWKNWCRKAKSNDLIIGGIVEQDTKKDKKAKIII